jgi:hypothetical protein
MLFKLKYSKIYKLSLKQKVLLIKGPLGYNYLKIPKTVSINHLNSPRVLIIQSTKSKNSNIKTFTTNLTNLLRATAFGTLETVELQGLGLSLKDLKKETSYQYDLYAKLGWSNDIIFNFSAKRLRANLYKKAKKNSNILALYSPDYSHLRNTLSNIVNCRQGKLKVQRSRFKRSRKNEGYSVRKIM